MLAVVKQFKSYFIREVWEIVCFYVLKMQNFKRTENALPINKL